MLLVVVILVAVANAQETKEDLTFSETKAKHHVVFVYDGSSYGSSYGKGESSYVSSYGKGGSGYGSSYDTSYDDGYEVKVKGKGKGNSKGLRTTYGYDGPSYSPISYGSSSYGGDGKHRITCPFI